MRGRMDGVCSQLIKSLMSGYGERAGRKRDEQLNVVERERRKMRDVTANGTGPGEERRGNSILLKFYDVESDSSVKQKQTESERVRR